MIDKIILENGSVQNISNFPEDLKETYKTVWETSQKSVIDMAADRAPFIDQTQSMNLWLSTPTIRLPLSSSLIDRAEPIKPADPVTKTFIFQEYTCGEKMKLTFDR